MKLETRKKLFALENEVLMLKKLREMQKILLSSGAYSTSNIEKQSMQFDKANVPEWERNIVSKMWKAQTKLSHKLLKEIDIVSDEILNEFETELKPIKEKTPKDILKEKLKVNVDNL